MLGLGCLMGGHQEACLHTGRSCLSLRAFVNTRTGGLSPLLSWPIIKCKLKTNQSLKLHSRNFVQML